MILIIFDRILDITLRKKTLKEVTQRIWIKKNFKERNLLPQNNPRQVDMPLKSMNIITLVLPT